MTLLWNPWWATPANVAVAVGSNLPCIAVQRYNRCATASRDRGRAAPRYICSMTLARAHDDHRIEVGVEPLQHLAHPGARDRDAPGSGVLCR